MKRPLAALGLALALAGCAQAPQPDPAAYTAQLHRTLAGTGYVFVGDDQLLELGRTMCSGIDAGLTRPRLADSSGLPPEVLQAVLDAATTHLCPEHEGF